MANFTGPTLCALTAVEVRTLLKSGEISAQDLLDAADTRVEQTEPQQNAMVTQCFPRARARIKPDTLLGGIPIGVKDLTEVAGVRTTYGTIGFKDHIPKASDPLVLAMETHGALVVGKTNTPEMGAGANTFNDVFGPTGNPHNRALNAGGSSGGAASGLATGQVWLSHGSDYGGSLRTPAAYCNVVGLRPSPGRAGGSGTVFDTLGVQGPMARNVADCALFLDAMQGVETPISFPAPATSFLSAVEAAPDTIRIGYMPDLCGHGPVEADVSDLLSAALNQAEKSGCTVEQVNLNTAGMDQAFRALRALAFATTALSLPAEISRHFKATIQGNAADAAALTANDLAKATLTRTQLYRDTTALLQHFDILAFPVVGLGPLPREIEFPPEVNGLKSRDYLDWLGFSNLATLTSLPALSLPIGRLPNGMPMGIQLIGPNRGEAKLLKSARTLERIFDINTSPIDPS
ncbi:MAG: amidase [Rhodobacteraceae bacterium]|nr:amidase [Paracoccaceae bacterium]